MSARRLLRGEGGAAAVEFAIVAPVLILSVLMMADIGLAVHSLFRLDQTIRNGAEAALDDPGATRVQEVLAAIGGTSGEGADVWTASRRCLCPSTGPVQCGTVVTCSGNRPTSIFYDIGGSRRHEGILLPDRTLLRSASVQVR